MKRHDKSAVPAKREELERFFANFNPAVQRKVQSVRLKNSSVLQSNRITEKLMQADIPLRRHFAIHPKGLCLRGRIPSD